jgi:hypothetical protein
VSVRSVVAALVAVIACLLLVPLGVDAAKPVKCSKRGSVTEARDLRARIFTVDYPRADETRYYGCLYSTGRVWELPSYRTYTNYLNHVALSPPYVAYGDAGSSSMASSESVWVFNLRTGKATDGPNFQSPTILHQLVLTRFGAIAWISYAPGLPPPGGEVEKLDRDGRTKLDPGPDIGPNSLALTRSGYRVYWSNGGQARLAPLR